MKQSLDPGTRFCERKKMYTAISQTKPFTRLEKATILFMCKR